MKYYKHVGIPLLKKERQNIMEIEKWPLVQAYGLDVFGQGFFTLKHEVTDINPEYYFCLFQKD